MTQQEINQLVSQSADISSLITQLCQKSYTIPSWEALLKDYEPTEHDIVRDQTTRKDKIKNGTVWKASRISVGLEKLLVKRMTEFTFALPVRRAYHNTEDSETKQQISRAIERIFKYARIDSENIKRGTAYYASCEACSVWYAVEKPNTLYGFKSQYKLKCKTYSPMQGVLLYPLFDEMDDLLAMSFKYSVERNGKTVDYFETYTDKLHVCWITNNNGYQEIKRENIKLLKIPAIYIKRPVPIYHGLTNLRQEIEYALSRDSDIIAYNSSPVLMVSGTIQGQENKGEENRVWRVENGGSVSYVSWNQSIEAMKYHVSQMLNLFWSQAQMPDISFENMKALGNIGYDARQTLLTDAHLKVGDEAGPWLEFLDREVNVVKEYLKLLNPEWASEIDDVEVENTITPFIQNDETAEIEKWSKASGVLVSNLEAIKFAGLSPNPEKTLEQIQKEKDAAQTTRMNSLFEGAE
jgi:hypothetical protein